jgi:hypothetical protein
MLMVEETNQYYHSQVGSLDTGLSPLLNVSEEIMFISGINNTDGTLHMSQTDRLLYNNGPGLHTLL